MILITHCSSRICLTISWCFSSLSFVARARCSRDCISLGMYYCFSTMVHSSRWWSLFVSRPRTAEMISVLKALSTLIGALKRAPKDSGKTSISIASRDWRFASSRTEYLASIDRSLSMSGRMYHIALATDLERHQRDASSILFSLDTSGFRAMKNEQGSKTLNIPFALLSGSLLLLYLTNKSIYIYIRIFYAYVCMCNWLSVIRSWSVSFFRSLRNLTFFEWTCSSYHSFVRLFIISNSTNCYDLAEHTEFFPTIKTHIHQAHLSSFSIE